MLHRLGNLNQGQLGGFCIWNKSENYLIDLFPFPAVSLAGTGEYLWLS